MENKNVIEKEENAVRSVYASPKVDVQEIDNEYILQAEIPGASKESVTVTVKDGELEIRAETDISSPGDEVYTEFENIVYHRKFQLGRDIDTESVKAEVNNGVLTLVLLKSEESKSRNIDIN